MPDQIFLEEEPRPLFSTIGGVEGGAGVDLFIAEDEMILWGTFHPPTSSSAHQLTFTEFLEALNNLGITSGFQERSIQEAIFQCNTEHKTLKGVVLARGTPPKGSRPAFLKLEPLLYQHHFPQEKNLSVDYKEFSPFVIVKKGELLARAYPLREGKPGRSVTGKDIPPGKKDVKFFKPGSHTIFAHGKVFAACAGRFLIEGDVFDVSDTLEIKGGVDYSTGHVVFPGNILVAGVIQDGFKLVSGGSITVKDTLDASEVMCKKDLHCSAGVIGKKPGIVRVGGQFEALYLENVQVEVLGNALIHKAILHSRLYCNGEIQAPEGCKFVSSLVMAKGSIHVAQLGNEHGTCHVVVGTDFAVHRRLEQVREEYKQEEERLFALKSRLEESGATRSEQYEGQLKEKLAALVVEINTLSGSLFNANATELVVSGDLYPGVTIEMGWAKLPITSKMRGKVFRLSEDKKSILVDKIPAP
jgi:uncharacterized protein (DUF342 family)